MSAIFFHLHLFELYLSIYLAFWQSSVVESNTISQLFSLLFTRSRYNISVLVLLICGCFLSCNVTILVTMFNFVFVCFVVQYCGVNRKSFNNIGIRESPIDVSTVEECQLAAEDAPWTEELHLTVKEQNILLGKSWLNGSIINAAMVRKACCWSEVVGLKDINGRDRGFSRSDSGQGFIQIIMLGIIISLLCQTFYGQDHTLVFMTICKH